MDNVARKRSSLKHENIFPEGMTLEQFIEMNKNKTIKWNQKMIIEEEVFAENEDKEKPKEPNDKVEQVSEKINNISIEPTIEKKRSSK
jgi:hypothetical protein